MTTKERLFNELSEWPLERLTNPQGLEDSTKVKRAKNLDILASIIAKKEGPSSQLEPKESGRSERLEGVIHIPLLYLCHIFQHADANREVFAACDANDLYQYLVRNEIESFPMHKLQNGYNVPIDMGSYENAERLYNIMQSGLLVILKSE